MSIQYKVCNCNRTMPLDRRSGERLGEALGVGPLPVHSEMCRREVGDFLQSLGGVDEVVVGCTQERALFAELAEQKNTVAPLRFVNLRETGGWSRQAGQALPKMAALLAEAALPDPEPVPVVEYESQGHVLIVGSAGDALPWARRLGEQLDVSVLLTSGNGAEIPQERSFPVFSGGQIKAEGWLGAFNVSWKQGNAIDLEACTRCNACVEACPHQAIGAAYQVDMDLCRGERDCVKACGAIGAIDFERLLTERSGSFDLIFDLSEQPLFAMHQPPQGYFAPGTDLERQFEASYALTRMVGVFEKPKFFLYKDKLCAHSRNEKIGCNACVEVCSAEAVSHDGKLVKINPNLCVGCGACTTVCPSGALTYAYPRPADSGTRFKTLLSTYAKAGGQQPALLLHSNGKGSALVHQLGRLAAAHGKLAGLPARVIPVGLHHTASVGIDLWLAAVAYGAANIAVLVTDEEAPQYLAALEKQIEIAQAILHGLGYQGRHIQLLRAASSMELDRSLGALEPAQVPSRAALFKVGAEKRTTLEFAIEHLFEHALEKPRQIALPAGSPYGAVTVNRQACTLCLSCVGACPESALLDNPAMPQLRFLEKNCVQCGLCEKTCPENAISLSPRLLLGEPARQSVVLNEAQPYHCIRCSKPFGTLSMIETMLAKLGSHSAFAGNLERLKMCSDCRVVDMMENRAEVSVSELKRPR